MDAEQGSGFHLERLVSLVLKALHLNFDILPACQPLSTVKIPSICHGRHRKYDGAGTGKGGHPRAAPIRGISPITLIGGYETRRGGGRRGGKGSRDPESEG